MAQRTYFDMGRDTWRDRPMVQLQPVPVPLLFSSLEDIITAMNARLWDWMPAWAVPDSTNWVAPWVVPDSTNCTLEEWNRRVDALCADITAYHATLDTEKDT